MFYNPPEPMAPFVSKHLQESWVSSGHGDLWWPRVVCYYILTMDNQLERNADYLYIEHHQLVKSVYCPVLYMVVLIWGSFTTFLETFLGAWGSCLLSVPFDGWLSTWTKMGHGRRFAKSSRGTVSSTAWCAKLFQVDHMRHDYKIVPPWKT